MTVRVHPFPSRTRQLSSLVPTILGWKRPGTIGRCQHKKNSSDLGQGGFFLFWYVFVVPGHAFQPTGHRCTLYLLQTVFTKDRCLHKLPPSFALQMPASSLREAFRADMESAPTRRFILVRGRWAVEDARPYSSFKVGYGSGWMISAPTGAMLVGSCPENQLTVEFCQIRLH